MIRRIIPMCAVAFLLFVTAVGVAQMPTEMNYQVMLTDDSDNPLADQSVQLEFRIYESEGGGSPLWTEVQNVTTNSIGVVSVVLGSVNPMDFLYSSPMWLEVRVDGQLMEPRRPLLYVPYSKFPLESDHAVDSDNLGLIPAEASVASSRTWPTDDADQPVANQSVPVPREVLADSAARIAGPEATANAGDEALEARADTE